MSSELFEFIKGIKRPWLIFALLLSGALLLFGASFDGGEKETAPDALASLCSQIDGVGRCETLISLDDDGKVAAVAVVCEGAESLSVKKDLYELISSLYGVGYNRISILKFSK